VRPRPGPGPTRAGPAAPRQQAGPEARPTCPPCSRTAAGATGGARRAHAAEIRNTRTRTVPTGTRASQPASQPRTAWRAVRWRVRQLGSAGSPPIRSRGCPPPAAAGQGVGFGSVRLGCLLVWLAAFAVAGNGRRRCRRAGRTEQRPAQAADRGHGVQPDPAAAGRIAATSRTANSRGSQPVSSDLVGGLDGYCAPNGASLLDAVGSTPGWAACCTTPLVLQKLVLVSFQKFTLFDSFLLRNEIVCNTRGCSSLLASLTGCLFHNLKIKIKNILHHSSLNYRIYQKCKFSNFIDHGGQRSINPHILTFKILFP
jgi:hypothetical protein